MSDVTSEGEGSDGRAGQGQHEQRREPPDASKQRRPVYGSTIPQECDNCGRLLPALKKEEHEGQHQQASSKA